MLKKKIIICLLLMGGLISYYFLNKYLAFGLTCPFYQITHLYCPGCGITRLLFSLLELDFYQAFRYNPLVFLLLLGFIIFNLIEIIKRKKIIINNKVVYILLVVVILYGVLRNLPSSPLAPTIIN